MPRRSASSPVGPSPRVRGAGLPVTASPVIPGTIPAGAGSSYAASGSAPSTWDHPRGCGEQHASGRDPGRRSGTIPAGAGSRSRSGPVPSRARDHPRGCGEQTDRHRPREVPPGPSPRVRGAALRVGLDVHRLGTIPAGAGSSPGCGRPWTGPRDHPRGCGEQCGFPGSFSQATGPSPRVRGAERPRPAPGRGPGTIPAGAGSSRPPPWPTLGPWDHPRGCGEQMLAVAVVPGSPGPSPRVRGADRVQGFSGFGTGTIPAGAGSSTCRTSTSPPRWDHPRGCGEQGMRWKPSNPVAGPSPRVRGAVKFIPTISPCTGTIPAGAGSRSRGPPTRPTCRDHPRGCGEQGPIRSPIQDTRGPSPRVRGAGSGSPHVKPGGGTIPAGAGSSARSGLMLSRTWDHPRGCGEQDLINRAIQIMGGPSPRVRGAAGDPARAPVRHGTIPAGAGSSRRVISAPGRWRDHPRGCGEQIATRLDRYEWGTIPAGAGSRGSPRSVVSTRRDHPRGCGEQDLDKVTSSLKRGPSPRVRGAD